MVEFKSTQSTESPKRAPSDARFRVILEAEPPAPPSPRVENLAALLFDDLSAEGGAQADSGADTQPDLEPVLLGVVGTETFDVSLRTLRHAALQVARWARVARGARGARGGEPATGSACDPGAGLAATGEASPARLEPSAGAGFRGGAGLRPGDTVCLIRLPRTSELLVAVAYAGLSAAGLRVLFPMAVDREHLGDWLARSEARAVLWAPAELGGPQGHDTDRALLAELEGELERQGLVAYDLERDVGLVEALRRAPRSSPDPRDPAVRAVGQGTGPETECLLLTTSGTSGESKLVRYRQGAFLQSCAAWEAAGLFSAERQGGRALCVLLAHSMGLRAFWNALWTRTPLCLIHPEWFSEHPARVRSLLRRMRPAHVTGGPAVVRTLLELGRVFPDLKESCYRDLRCLVSSGATFAGDAGRRVEASLGVALHNAFGMTETLQVLSTLAPGPLDGRPPALGNPLPGVRVGLEPAPGHPADVYRMHVRSPFGFAGYLQFEPETGTGTGAGTGAGAGAGAGIGAEPGIGASISQSDEVPDTSSCCACPAPAARRRPGPGRQAAEGESGADEGDPWFFSGDLVRYDGRSLQHLGREAADFINDGFGVKVARARLERLYEALERELPVHHVEWLPLRYEPGFAALVFWAGEDGVWDETDEGASGAPSREGRGLTDVAVLRRIEQALEVRNDRLFSRLDGLEARHLTVGRFACVAGPPLRTRKGNVRHAELAQRHRRLVERLTARHASGEDLRVVDREGQLGSADQRYVLPRLGRLLRLARLDKRYVSGRGDRLVYEEAGRRVEVLDCVGGYGGNLLGHNHPAVLDAAREMLDGTRVCLADQGSRRTESGALARRLSERLGRHTGASYVVRFGSTGAEAVEMALAHAALERQQRVERLVRELRQRVGGRFPVETQAAVARLEAALHERPPVVLALEGSFHGHSLGARSVLSDAAKRQPFAALTGLRAEFLPWSGGAGEAPGGGAPGGEFPGGEAPGCEAPGCEAPGCEAPGCEAPEGEAPEGEAPGGEFPGGEAPDREVPVGEGPGSEAPGGEVPGSEAPGGEASRAAAAGFAARVEQAVARHRITVEVPDVGDGELRFREVTLDGVIAAIAEPVLGEGGVREVPAAVLAALGAHPFPLIMDEIQAGLGRCGSWLASQGVTADYYLFAKALGGGVAKISALAVERHRYVERFDTLYSSTFAGDALSSHVAARVLDVIDQEDVPGRAAERGQALGARLAALVRRYPEVVSAVGGRGLMQGVTLSPACVTGSVLLRIFAERELLGSLAASWLLDRHAVRMLPTLSAPFTLRVEPSAFVRDEDLDQLEAALAALCRALRDRDTGELLGPLVQEEQRLDASPAAPAAPAAPAGRWSLPVLVHPPAARAARVGFLNHLVHPERELALADPGLARLSRAARRELAHKLMALTELRPVMVSAENLLDDRLWFATFSIPGDVATLEGLHRAGDRARVVERIQEAVDRAADQGCEVVALGAFTSILSRDGEALVAPPGVQLTTGNTLTVATGALQLRRACVQAGLGRDGAPPRLAVVGAAGNIGAGLVAHLTSPAAEAPRFDEVLLVGRNRARLEQARQRLLRSWGARWGSRAPPTLEISTELRELARVDAVAIATNTNEPLIYPSHLGGRGAVVIADISTPSAVSAEARALPHVTVVPLAGLVSVPGAASFVMSAASAPGMAFCCAAEAMILGLEPGRVRGLRLVGRVEPRHVELLDELARTHGFYDQVSGGGYRQRQESP